MIEMVPINCSHYDALYDVICENEPYAKALIPSLWHFRKEVPRFEGFALVDDEKVVGSVTFSNLTPLTDISMHLDIAKEYQGRWVTRGAMRKIAEFCFGILKVQRISCYLVKGISPLLHETALVKIGFHLEGIRECAVLFPDGYHDQLCYSLLKHRCRWS